MISTSVDSLAASMTKASNSSNVSGVGEFLEIKNSDTLFWNELLLLPLKIVLSILSRLLVIAAVKFLCFPFLRLREIWMARWSLVVPWNIFLTF